MEIKIEKQLPEGTVIEYTRRTDRQIDGDLNLNGNLTRYKVENLQVIKCYKNFVMFRQLEPPHLTVNLTNNELYQMGVYKESDFIKEFIR